MGGNKECIWQRTELHDMLRSKENHLPPPTKFLLRSFL